LQREQPRKDYEKRCAENKANENKKMKKQKKPTKAFFVIAMTIH
jgi:hypothetical protein